MCGYPNQLRWRCRPVVGAVRVRLSLRSRTPDHGIYMVVLVQFWILPFRQSNRVTSGGSIGGARAVALNCPEQVQGWRVLFTTPFTSCGEYSVAWVSGFCPKLGCLTARCRTSVVNVELLDIGLLFTFSFLSLFSPAIKKNAVSGKHTAIWLRARCERRAYGSPS